MRTLAILVAVIAVASAVTYTPPARKCAWNVEITFKDGDTLKGIYKYWVNGRFIAQQVKNDKKEVILHAVYRPDVSNATYYYADGKCNKDVTNAFWLKDAFLAYLTNKQEYTKSEAAQYNGKDCTKYCLSALGVDGFCIYVDKSEEIIAMTSVVLPGVAEVDFGSSASMGKFALESTENGCDNGAYDSGNDDYVMCAAATVKAALALVLALIAAVLAF